MRKFLLTICFILIATQGFSAEFLKKTVKPSGGDYTTLEACMNANEQNLTGDGWFTVEIDGTWSSADTTAVVIHNYTTTSSDYINIYTTAAARHDGKWDTGAYRVERSDNSATTFTISSQYVRLTGLQVKNTDATSTHWSRAVGVYAANTTVDKCILWAVGGRAYSANELAGNQTTNSVFINNSAQSTVYVFGAWNNATGNSFHNCVFANTSSGLGIERDFYQITAKNCYAYSASGTAWDSGITITTSASDDGSASTSTVAYSTSSGAYFTNVTAGSEDFHIGASSELKDAGTDLSATFTDDIDGDTRPTGANTWDIGADEYVAAATRRLIF